MANDNARFNKIEGPLKLRGEIPDPYQLPIQPIMPEPKPTKPRTARIAMTVTEAEFIYGIVQNHITEKVLTNRATAQDFAPYTNLIKRIKALAER